MVLLGGIHSVLGAPSLSSLGIRYMGQGLPVDNSDIPGTGFLKVHMGLESHRRLWQALLRWLI